MIYKTPSKYNVNDYKYIITSNENLLKNNANAITFQKFIDTETNYQLIDDLDITIAKIQQLNDKNTTVSPNALQHELINEQLLNENEEIPDGFINQILLYNQKILFTENELSSQFLYKLYSKMPKNENIDIFLIENDYFLTAKLYNIEINSNAQAVSMVKFTNLPEIYTYILQNRQDDEGIVLNNENLLNPIRSALNICTSNDFELTILDIFCNLFVKEEMFCFYFISILRHIAPDLFNELVKFENLTIQYNLITKNEITKYARELFKNNQNIIQCLDFITNITQNGTIEKLSQDLQKFIKYETKSQKYHAIHYNSFRELRSILDAILISVSTNSKRDSNIEMINKIGYKLYNKVYFIANSAIANNDLLLNLLARSQNIEILYIDKFKILGIISYFQIKFNIKINYIDKIANNNATISEEVSNKVFIKQSQINTNFSYKKLITYINEKREFYEKYILGLTKVNKNDRIFAEKGIFLHEAMSTIFLNYRTKSTSEIIEILTDKAVNHIADSFTRNNILLELEDFINTVLTLISEFNLEEWKCEEVFTANLEIHGKNISITAKPDLIIKDKSGCITIYDLKTGSENEKQYNDKNEINMKHPQMLLYAWVLRQNGIPVNNIQYIYYNKTASKPMSEKIDNFEENLSNFQGFFTQILSEIYHPDGLCIEFDE